MGDSGRRLAGYGLVTLLAAFTYLYGLDSQHIPKNGDEYPYEHITRLTAESGRLLPLRSELPGMRNTKPPLLFWQGIASTGWGRRWTLWDLRAPSVVYTLLTGVLVFLLGSRLSGRPETGLVAGLSFLAFFSTYRYGRPFLTNPPEVFWLFLPFFALLYWRRAAPASRFAFPVLAGVAIGIALLYKSFALVVPAGIGLAGLYLHSRDYRLVPFLARDSWKVLIALVRLPGAVRRVVPPRPRPGIRVEGVRAGGEPGEVRPARRLSPEAPVGRLEPLGSGPGLSPERGPPLLSRGGALRPRVAASRRAQRRGARAVDLGPHAAPRLRRAQPALEPVPPARHARPGRASRSRLAADPPMGARPEPPGERRRDRGDRHSLPPAAAGRTGPAALPGGVLGAPRRRRDGRPRGAVRARAHPARRARRRLPLHPVVSPPSSGPSTARWADTTRTRSGRSRAGRCGCRPTSSPRRRATAFSSRGPTSARTARIATRAPPICWRGTRSSWSGGRCGMAPPRPAASSANAWTCAAARPRARSGRSSAGTCWSTCSCGSS